MESAPRMRNRSSGYRSPMTRWDVAQICLNGHVITESYNSAPEFRKNYCSRCGAKTVIACEQCETQIQGRLIGSSVVFLGSIPTAPRFCHGCGHPYPWTEAALSAAHAIVEEDESLSEDERARLAESLDDLVTDNPRTEVSANRFKKLIAKAGPETAEGLKSVLISVVTEAAKKAIW